MWMGKTCRSWLALGVYAWILLAVPPLLAFKPRYHDEFTRRALRDITRTIDGHTLRFTARAIQQIVDNNKNQDDGWCLPPFGSPSPPFSISANHFDGEELSAGSSLLVQRLRDAQTRLRQSRADGEGARRLLGQALHATQDYYAHSNRAEMGLGVENQMVSIGMSPSEAVVSATSRAAEALGVGHLVGSLSAGKKADLLIVDGDPTRDISALRKLDTVMLGGRVVSSVG
jgi:hypothetical protein